MQSYQYIFYQNQSDKNTLSENYEMGLKPLILSFKSDIDFLIFNEHYKARLPSYRTRKSRGTPQNKVRIKPV